jgi:hypothetical protein
MKTIGLILISCYCCTATFAQPASDTTKVGTVTVSKPKDCNKGGAVYEVVDQMPRFTATEGSLFAYFTNNIHLAAQSPNGKSTLTAYISFVIDLKGKVQDLTIMNEEEVDLNMRREIFKAFKAMPKWIPGVLNNQNVCVKMVQPLHFRTL